MNDTEHKNINNMRNVCNDEFQIIGSRTAEFKPVENPPVDDRSAMNLKSGGSAKQEGDAQFLLGFPIRLSR